MAMLLTTDRKMIPISEDKATKIWLVLNGELEPETEAQADYIATVQNVYLNRSRTDLPNSYILANKAKWAEMDRPSHPLPRKTGGARVGVKIGQQPKETNSFGMEQS